ncbi:MAG: TlpA disulfide reductase family protein [Persephonella sp.]|nr:TlpA disulfide reductase family protein [Persephonella sp.]
MKSFIALLLLTVLLVSCQKEKKDRPVLTDHILLDKSGKPVPLSENRLIVLNFMAYSCSSCMEEIPVMKKVIKEEPFRGRFQIIGMVIDSDKGDLSDPLFPICPNHKHNFVRFPVPGTPTTYIITPEGKKLVIIYGAVTEENFRKFLLQALEKAKKSK